MKVYGNILSPPCKAVYSLLKHLNIEFERKELGFLDGTMKTPEYLKIHTGGKVPALDDNGHVILESWTQLRYICCTKAGPEARALYPADHKKRARINEAIGEVNDLRLFADLKFIDDFMGPLEGKELSPFTKGKYKENLDKHIKFLNAKLEGKKFIVNDELSIVDLMLVAMVDELEVLGIPDLDKTNFLRYYEGIKVAVPAMKELKDEHDAAVKEFSEAYAAASKK